MFMLILNEPINVADLQKLANQLANAKWRTSDKIFCESNKTLVV